MHGVVARDLYSTQISPQRGDTVVTTTKIKLLFSAHNVYIGGCHGNHSEINTSDM